MEPIISRNKAYSLLKECSKKNLQHLRQVQFIIACSGLDSVSVLVDNFIRLFGSLGCLLEANQAFNKALHPSKYTWSSIIWAHANPSQNEAALELYSRIQTWNKVNDRCIYLATLKACALSFKLKQGRHIHQQIISIGVQIDDVLGSSLVHMYAKCGSLEESCKVFEMLQHSHVVVWNALIVGYVQHDRNVLALECFHNMQRKGIKPDKVTFLGILRACSSIGSIEQGRLINDHIMDHGLDSPVFLGNSLIDMYAKCGSLNECDAIFNRLQNKDVISWNAIISGYVGNDKQILAMNRFYEMQESGEKPNKVTFLSILKACGNLGDKQISRFIHNQILEDGLQQDIVICNTIIDTYAKSGSCEESHKAFNEMSNPDVVSWNAIISGYALNDKNVASLECFQQMQEEGISPDRVTYSCILKACGAIGSTKQGRIIHNQILRHEAEWDAVIEIILVDMYAKCGSLEEASKVFDMRGNKSVVSCNALFAGYAQQGEISLALKCLEMMEENGIQPDKVTMVCLLVAFSHMGIVDEGSWYFESISDRYGIMPDIDHHVCMVNLFGRAGCFAEAEKLLQATEKTNVCGWRSLLGACTIHGNMQLAMQCFDKVVALDPSYAAPYVLMSNIYVLMSNIYVDSRTREETDNIQMPTKNVGECKKPEIEKYNKSKSMHLYGLDLIKEIDFKNCKYNLTALLNFIHHI